jgi:hypothetical protein
MYRLTVTIHGNPDRNQGEWEETHTLSASDMKTLRKVVNDFQRDNDVGGGNWGNAELLEDGRMIGHMSYNGRVWKGKYWEENREEVIL